MAKRKRKDKPPVLYRVEKFQLLCTPEQESLLVRISDGLREIYNWGLQWRTNARELQERKKELEDATFADCLKEIGGEELGLSVPERIKDPFMIQLYGLTVLLGRDKKQALWRAIIPQNWKQETIDALNGAFNSFFALIKNADADASPPQFRSARYACEIAGRVGFYLRAGHIIFGPGNFGKETLRFPVPENLYRPLLLRTQGGRPVKFTIYRDESDLARPGRWFVSVAYETLQPDPQPFNADEAVYVLPCLSDEGSYLLVSSPQGEQKIELWRPDLYWMPKVGELEEWMKRYKKGSKRWKACARARRKKYRRMQGSQKYDHRRKAAALLELGSHAVVPDIVIRSKEGKLADEAKADRTGPLGHNWRAQNTGALGELFRWLEEKTKEHGGSLVRHPVPERLGLPEDVFFRPIGFDDLRAFKADFLGQ